MSADRLEKPQRPDFAPDGVLESALYAYDLDAAEAFYGGLLGLEVITRAAGRHVFFRCGAGVVLIFNPQATMQPPGNPDLPVPPHGARGQGHLCFRARADDIDRWASHLMQAEVAIEADFRWPNGARSIYFRDPAGNSLEFAEPGIWNLT
jgi:catechol 2,3-dioxygenase-like lactoylglutathione lyase family enzyme